MSRIAYVNGRYVPHRDAGVSIDDRGLLFADAVYEVCEVRGRALVDWPRHLARLKRSLGELRIRMPMSEAALSIILRETVRRNRVDYGLVYMQISRGAARRDHAFPPASVPPGLFVTARSLNRERAEKLADEGVSVITVKDNRWERVDIKSTSLLPNVLARQAARDQGAYEAWFVDRDGFVTEGAATNAWIVTADGAVITRPGGGILMGITRAVLVDLLNALQLRLEERPFTVAEAYSASEAFITAATQIVQPVIRIDGHPVGSGAVGPIARRLRRDFHGFAHFFDFLVSSPHKSLLWLASAAVVPSN